MFMRVLERWARSLQRLRQRGPHWVPLLACAGAPAVGADASRIPGAVPDTLSRRLLACTGCHGREGRAGPDGYYPRIAGKPAGYLLNQLRNFRDGRRSYRAMTALLANLSDEYLAEIAAHFAAIELPYPPPAAAPVPQSVLARGETLITQGDARRGIPACVDCHGRVLTGVAPDIPGLLGLPRDYLNAQLGAWQRGQRRATAPDCMADIAMRLKPEDVAAISAWLSHQPLPADTRPAAALVTPPPMRCGNLPAKAQRGSGS